MEPTHEDWQCSGLSLALLRSEEALSVLVLIAAAYCVEAPNWKRY